MTVDAAVGPPPPAPPLPAPSAIDRPAAAPPSPSSDRPRPPAPSPPPGAGELRAPGMPPEAERLKAQLLDPALRVTSFRDEATGRFVLRLTERASGDVVDQYPPERLLRLFAAMREAGAAGDGGLIDERA